MAIGRRRPNSRSHGARHGGAARRGGAGGVGDRSRRSRSRSRKGGDRGCGALVSSRRLGGERRPGRRRCEDARASGGGERRGERRGGERVQSSRGGGSRDQRADRGGDGNHDRARGSNKEKSREERRDEDQSSEHSSASGDEDSSQCQSELEVIGVTPSNTAPAESVAQAAAEEVHPAQEAEASSKEMTTGVIEEAVPVVELAAASLDGSVTADVPVGEDGASRSAEAKNDEQPADVGAIVSRDVSVESGESSSSGETSDSESESQEEEEAAALARVEAAQAATGSSNSAAHQNLVPIVDASKSSGPTTPDTAAGAVVSQQKLNVQGCSDKKIGDIVHGEYDCHSENHGRTVFKRAKPFNNNGVDSSVLLYYWDDRDGPESQGWWFGPEIGGEEVWAHSSDAGLAPPHKDWRAPHDGDIDPAMRVLPLDDSAKGIVSSAAGTESCKTLPTADQSSTGLGKATKKAGPKLQAPIQSETASNKPTLTDKEAGATPSKPKGSGEPHSSADLSRKRQQKREDESKTKNEESRKRAEAKKKEDDRKQKILERRKQIEEAKAKRRAEREMRAKARKEERQRAEAERKRCADEREKMRSERLGELQQQLDEMQKEEDECARQLEELRRQETEIRKKETDRRRRQEEVRREMLEIAKSSAKDLEQSAADSDAAAAAQTNEPEVESSGEDELIEEDEIAQEEAEQAVEDDDDQAETEEGVDEESSEDANVERSVEKHAISEEGAASSDCDDRKEDVTLTSKKSVPKEEKEKGVSSDDKHDDDIEGKRDSDEGKEKTDRVHRTGPDGERRRNEKKKNEERGGSRRGKDAKGRERRPRRKDDEGDRDDRDRRKRKRDTEREGGGRAKLKSRSRDGARLRGNSRARGKRRFPDQRRSRSGEIRRQRRRPNIDESNRGGIREDRLARSRNNRRGGAAEKNTFGGRQRDRSRHKDESNKRWESNRRPGSSSPKRRKNEDEGDRVYRDDASKRRDGKEVNRRAESSSPKRRRDGEDEGERDRRRRDGEDEAENDRRRRDGEEKEIERDRRRREGEDEVEKDKRRRDGEDEAERDRDKRRRDGQDEAERDRRRRDAEDEARKDKRRRDGDDETERDQRRRDAEEEGGSKEDRTPKKSEKISLVPNDARHQRDAEKREQEQKSSETSACDKSENVDAAEEQRQREESWKRKKEEEAELRRKKEEDMKKHEEELERKRCRRRELEEVRLKEQEEKKFQEREEKRAKERDAEPAHERGTGESKTETVTVIATHTPDQAPQADQKADEASEKKQRQQKAVSHLLGVAKELTHATAANFPELKRRVEDTLSTELEHCGDQGKLVEAEVSKVIEMATALFSKKNTPEASTADEARELHSKFKHDKAPPPAPPPPPPAATPPASGENTAGLSGPSVVPPPPMGTAVGAGAALQIPVAIGGTVGAGTQTIAIGGSVAAAAQLPVAMGGGVVGAVVVPPPTPPSIDTVITQQVVEMSTILDAVESRVVSIETEFQHLSNSMALLAPAQAHERAQTVIQTSLAIRRDLPNLKDRMQGLSASAPTQHTALLNRVVQLDARSNNVAGKATRVTSVAVASARHESATAEVEKLRADVGLAIRNAMADRGVQGEAVFTASDLDADGVVSLQDFIATVTRSTSKFSIPQITQLFEYLDDDRVGRLAKDEFLRCVRIFYKVVVASPLSNDVKMAISRPIRRLEVGEILELMKGPVHDSAANVLRVGGRAMSDGATGWATIVSNGTHFLNMTRVYLRARVQTPLTRLFNPHSEVVRLTKLGETFECLVWEKPVASTQNNVWRAKVKAREDGAVGWATTADQGNVVLALAMDIA